ncbi:hypothetical protein [Dyadobacter tibetensis]|uniref:hypothetical protein n=1 Tax=Dyadobacter tibetensis TaxID=1211851 RepID=UPI000472CF1B|nr:hypothetical protein [Dyadobacter tibetensis]
MKKEYAFVWCILVGLICWTASCKKKVAPVSERIAKAWLAETVNHDNVTVYLKGGTANTWPGYSDFRLTLSTVNGENRVTYVEFNKNSFSGTWALEGDSKLILKGLEPQPTGTGGTIEFTITSLDDTKLVLTRISTSKKTGDTKNTYTLTR